MKKKNKSNKSSKYWLLRNLVVATAIMVVIVVTATISLNKYTRHGESYILPDYSGMSISEAENINPEMMIIFDVIDSVYTRSAAPGAILDQYPKPGNFVKSGRRIAITINTNAPKSVKIPYVAGYSLRQAKNRLLGSGLKIDKIIYEQDIATNNVLRQLYNDNEIKSKTDMTAPVGSGVTLIVGASNLKETVRIENYVGKSYYEVRNILWEDGLNIVTQYNSSKIDANNIDKTFVYSQKPMPGDTLLLGGEVVISLTVDSLELANGKTAMKERIWRLDSLATMRRIISDSIKWASVTIPDSINTNHYNNLLLQINDEIEKTKQK